MTTPVSSATSLIAAALTRLSEDVPEALEGASVESVVDLLAVLRQLRQTMHSLEAFVEAEAVTRIPYSKAPQRIGEYMVEIRGGTTRLANWRHDDLAWAVLKPLCFDPDTGELVPEVRDIVDRVRSELFAAVSVGYWRTTRLKALGIDAGEYAERVESRRTVQLTPVTDEPEQAPATEAGEAA